jgi:hypothetical protein
MNDGTRHIIQDWVSKENRKKRAIVLNDDDEEFPEQQPE